jgi:hypothetical protein
MPARKGNVMIKKMCKLPVLSLGLLAGLVLYQNVARADGLTLTINNVDGSAGVGGVYVDPYGMTLSAGSKILLVLAMPCDDFVGHISVGDSWSVTETSIGQVGVNGPQKFPNNANNPAVSLPILDPTNFANSIADPSRDQIQLDYYMAGYIASFMITGRAGSDPTGAYSYALWKIFDPTLDVGVVNPGSGPTVNIILSAAYRAALNPAINLPPGLVIFTPTPDSTAGPQEFIGIDPIIKATSYVPAPEASITCFLAFNLLALPGVVFFVRRRFRRDA